MATVRFMDWSDEGVTVLDPERKKVKKKTKVLPIPRCFTRECKHFFAEEQNGKKLVCTAFPKGIPHSIAYGKNDHLTSQKGDDGVTYERLKR